MTRSRILSAAALTFLSVASGAAIVACRRGGAPADAAAQKRLFHCPMHPTYVSDRPGQCPICKMDLVPMQGADAPSRTTGRKVLYYRSPMDPGVRSDVPRKDEMGMDYVPVYEDEATGPVVAGRAMVALSPERRQLLGVRSERVGRRPLERTIRTVGRVAMDERRVHHVHTKYEAYVEKLYVNFVGQEVRKGDHLAALYSPELVATQQEYLLAYQARQRLADSGIPSVAKGGADLLEAARQRLLFWDMAAGDIQRLEQTGKVERTVDLHAELPGFVIQKAAVHGMRVTPADILFDIADLSHVWILADVYETDLALVSVGMEAAVSLPYQQGRSWHGSVTFVNPLLDPATRTVKVRVEVPNQDTVLKPDMFADVVLRKDLGVSLFVADSAVLKSGERRLVFLDRGDGRLEPREITTGERVEGGYAVLSGLAEGDLVVTSANFLIDSESSLRAALSAMGTSGAVPAAGSHTAEPGRPGTQQTAPAPSAGAGHAHGRGATAPARSGAPAAKTGVPEAPPKAGQATYTCPMHPQVKSDEPGSCPLCGMDLVPAAPQPPATQPPAPPAHVH